MASRFTVRVLLQDEDDYTQLHQYMAEEGFTKFIESAEGQQFKLPPAEYSFVGELPSERVLDKARAAAARTSKDFQILVSPCEPRIWFGLAKAQAFERIAEYSYRR